MFHFSFFCFVCQNWVLMLTRIKVKFSENKIKSIVKKHLQFPGSAVVQMISNKNKNIWIGTKYTTIIKSYSSFCFPVSNKKKFSSLILFMNLLFVIFFYETNKLCWLIAKYKKKWIEPTLHLPNATKNITKGKKSCFV